MCKSDEKQKYLSFFYPASFLQNFLFVCPAEEPEQKKTLKRLFFMLSGIYFIVKR